MELEHIRVWRDEAFRKASFEMALDHALLDHGLKTGEAMARFYSWNESAVTVGYFHKSKEGLPGSALPIRRYTGGGLVEHGDDITFTIIFPSGSRAAQASSAIRYQWIHSKLADALATEGVSTALHQEMFHNSERPCFQHAVSEDLIDPDTGEKICGGAQRRCRGAVIHQGSIRLPESLRNLDSRWISAFLNTLSAGQEALTLDEKAILTDYAKTLEIEKYGTESWNLRS